MLDCGLIPVAIWCSLVVQTDRSSHWMFFCCCYFFYNRLQHKFKSFELYMELQSPNQALQVPKLILMTTSLAYHIQSSHRSGSPPTNNRLVHNVPNQSQQGAVHAMTHAGVSKSHYSKLAIGCGNAHNTGLEKNWFGIFFFLGCTLQQSKHQTSPTQSAYPSILVVFVYAHLKDLISCTQNK